VLERPQSAPSPVYLFGGVGCGKTHLLEGLAEELARKHPGQRVLALTSEDFANQFTQALDARSLPSFRQRFRNVDLLCVDDVDFFDGKRVIQEEFLNTLRQLLRQEKTLVLTADRHPRLLSRSADELVSVLQSGLVCRIEAPDEATRKAVVRGLAGRLKLQATSDALDYLAARFTRNIRELEGAVHFLCNWQQSTGSRASLSATRDAVAALVRDCVRIVRLSDVEQAVCSFFNVPPEELRSARRERAVAAPRMLAMYLARRLTPAAYSAIGEYFGGRNHSTVMSAERKVEASIQARSRLRIGVQDWTMNDVVAALEQRLAAV
jgi:chromosomal replication initiator protein